MKIINASITHDRRPPEGHPAAQEELSEEELEELACFEMVGDEERSDADAT